MQQAVTHAFIQKLRHQLHDELSERFGHTDEIVPDVLASFDRAALATVLDAGEAPAPSDTNKYRERGRRAAATRKRNKLKAAQDTTKGVRHDGAEAAAGA